MMRGETMSKTMPKCMACVNYLCVLDMHAEGIEVPDELLAEARVHFAMHD
jgi:hypothetical protein